MITTIQNSKITAQIKHLGAELCSLQNNHGKEYMWDGKPQFWAKHSPILFPIVGTLKNDSYHYNDQKYTLSRHGFARDMEFRLSDKQENRVVFTLHHSDKTLIIYPFEFELHLIYTVIDSTLTIEYVVINGGNSKMPFSIGGHPAFSLPKNFETYSIIFEKEEALEYHILTDNLIINDKKVLVLENNYLPLSYELFKNDALIFKKIESNSLIILENNQPYLKVSFEDFPNLGIWTLDNAPFICIEPWFGYSDTNNGISNLFEKEGIQILNPAEVFTSKFSIETY
ncbi:galactose mutarotase-like enzyme [Flavobacterium sp. PL11]|uniref:aldose 1-epimerase family protein n=1 Tax=Flavobacterium sp. PL11 TaxID=3071717 RepID=UPI002DF75375|nr:galactose mutarotase-like enzyme [Flavobacterium sp. PL11]